MSKIFGVMGLWLGVVVVGWGVEGQVKVLDLPLALQMGMAAHPTLLAKQAAREAAVGRWRQAGTWSNPVIELASEEVPVQPFQWSEGKQILQIEQSIDIGGKIGALERMGLVRMSLADANYEVAWREVRAAIQLGFVEVLLTQERLNLARTASQVAEEVAKSVKSQASAGSVSPVETTRAEIEAAAFASEVEEATFQLESARLELRRAMSFPGLKVERYEGKLIDEWSVPSWDAVNQSLSQHPLLRIKRWELEESKASAERTRAEGWPDLGVRVGMGRGSENRGAIAQAGISLPFPIFNKLDGAILEAEAVTREKEQEEEAARREIEADGRLALAKITQALKQVKRYREVVLPGAESVVNAMKEGLQKGKFRLIDVLDAQRALAEARRVRLGALSVVNQQRWRLEQLLGVELEK